MESSELCLRCTVPGLKRVVVVCRAYDSGQAPHTRQPEGVVAARVHLADTLSHPYDALFCSRGAVYLCAGSPAALANPRYAVRSGQPGMRLRRGYQRDGATALGPGGVCGCFSQVRSCFSSCKSPSPSSNI